MDSNYKINHNMLLSYISQTSEGRNSYFLHWYFDWKSCFVVFFHEWNEWKNPQFNFSSQNLSIERNFSNEMEKKPRYYTYYFSIE